VKGDEDDLEGVGELLATNMYLYVGRSLWKKMRRTSSELWKEIRVISEV
jgi:hypothetical protein